MHETATLLLFWGAFGLAVMSPGPNFAVLLGTATRAGRGAAVRTAIGFAIGEAGWGFGALFGMAALVAAHPWLGTSLRFAGGVFLIYLGLMSLRAAWRGSAAPHAGAAASGVWRGIGLMALNPKAGVFWVSLTGLLIGPDTGRSTTVAAVGGAVVISLVWHMFLALAMSSAPVLRAYARIRRRMDATLGALLGAIGVRLVIAG
jgi:threonine/homoserine/homoserine lactone efflux protein